MKKKVLGCLGLAMIFVFLCTGAGYGAAENLDEARALIKGRFYQDVNEDVLKKSSIHEMVYSLNDPYSEYIKPELFKDFLASLDGNYEGIGMTIGEVNGNIEVINPIPGSPAEKAGIKPGDIITHVDGNAVSGLASGEVAAKIRGLEGSKVSVTVNREGKSLNFLLQRKAIQLPSLEYRMIGSGIGYIYLNRFTSDSSREMEEALDDLLFQNMETLVMDLRDDPGGLLDVAVDIAGEFVPKGPVVHVVQRGNREYVLRSFKTPLGIPTAVLVNERTASAAEILAGAIQDAKTGFIVGTKTYGKGCVQTIFTLSNGGGLKLTTAKYLTRGRQDIHGKGLTPDILEQDQDKQLEVAIKKLGSSLSLFDVQMSLGSKIAFVGFKTYQLPVEPYMIKGNLMVPLREVIGYSGGTVRWEKGKTIVKSAKEKFEIDGVTKTIKTAQGRIIGKVVIKNGYTMIPVRELSEIIGYDAGWQSKSKSVYLLNKAN